MHTQEFFLSGEYVVFQLVFASCSSAVNFDAIREMAVDEVIAEANSRGLTHEMTSCEN